MRYGFVLLLLVFALVCATVAYAAPFGKVYFVKLTGSASDASSDVCLQEVPDGQARVLIAHQSLPVAFKGRIESAQPSPDGTLLLLGESRVTTIRNIKTGATRRMLGGTYSLDSSTEKVVSSTPGATWLRLADGRLRKLVLAGPHDKVHNLSWTPRGHLLYLFVRRNKGKFASLRLFDPLVGKSLNINSVAHPVISAWPAHGQGIYVVDQSDDGTGRVLQLTGGGHAHVLFTWPRFIYGLAVSSNGSYITLADARGHYLLDNRGKLLYTLRVMVGEEHPSTNASFSPDGTSLALLISQATGEPHVNIHEELWTVSVPTGAAQRLTEWNAMLGNTPGGDPMHKLLGWTPDGRTLLIIERPGTIGGPETYWQKLLHYPLKPNQPATLFFDSGSFVIDVEWQAGK